MLRVLQRLLFSHVENQAHRKLLYVTRRDASCASIQRGHRVFRVL